MFTHSNTTKGQKLRQASGEELLMLAIFGPADLKPRIDNELDRRALASTARGMEFTAYTATSQSGYAA